MLPFFKLTQIFTLVIVFWLGLLLPGSLNLAWSGPRPIMETSSADGGSSQSLAEFRRGDFKLAAAQCNRPWPTGKQRRIELSQSAEEQQLELTRLSEGIARLEAEHPDVPIYTAAIDRQLDENGYIRPGLGDAGDRIFGTI